MRVLTNPWLTRVTHPSRVPGSTLYSRLINAQSEMTAEENARRQAPAVNAHTAALRMPPVSDASMVGGSGLYSYAVCEWLRPCEPTVETVGSACNVHAHNVTSGGYCFESPTGSLECGRVIGASRPADLHPVQGRSGNRDYGPEAAADLRPSYTDTPLRCPRGAPITSHVPGTRERHHTLLIHRRPELATP